jgi:Transposase Tn5 dimerisation domain/Transposase DNA-binding
LFSSSDFGEEFVGIEFNDQRLTKRVVQIAESLGGNCSRSIPSASKGRAEMEATYRFMNNSKVTPAKILGPHVQATVERIKQSKVSILVHDSSEIDLTRPTQQVEGAGPLSFNTRRGSYVHPLMAFTDQGLALGILWQKHWVRKSIRTGVSHAEKCEDNRKRPFEEKESVRWVEAVRAGREAAEQCPDSQCVIVSDSESDIYEVLAEPRALENGRSLEIIVRSACDRNIEEKNGIDKLMEQVRSGPVLGRMLIDVSKRIPKIKEEKKTSRTCAREARTTEVEIRACTAAIRCPRNGPRRPSLTYQVVLVEESSPPTKEEAIQWMLITSLPIQTIEEVNKVIAYYCIRWQIEIYFRTLKSGCRIQERYFEKMNRWENSLAIYMVIAWKILYLCRLGQKCPNLPCDLIFSDSEWKAVYTIVQKTPLPDTPPTINEMIRMISTLGGYVNRNTTIPGVQTLWLGLQRVYDFARAWDTFGPETKNKKPTKKNLNKKTCVVR